MYLRFAFLAAVAFLLASCANEGVIVQKNTNALPFTHSYGVDGSYAFLLRDNTGAVHRQIVTPEVFAQYNVGQYFNDLQPGSASAAPSRAAEDKVVLTATRRSVSETTTPRLAQVRQTPAQKARHLASKTHRSHKHIATTKKPVLRAREQTSVVATAPVVVPVKTAELKPAEPKPEPSEADIVFVPVARCR